MLGIRKSKTRKAIAGVDPQLLIRDAAKLLPDPTRRLFLRGGASLGALAFLAGCDIVDEFERRDARCRRSPISMTGCRAGCSIPTASPRPIRTAW